MKSGQTRSHFEVDLFKQNWSLSASGFDSEFNNGIFIFVHCLELPKIAIKILMHRFFAFFWAIWGPKIDGSPQNLAWT